jgi:hypothetical protein
MLSAAQDLMATNPMVLTVAQAEFTPIRPNPTETDAYTATDTLSDLLNAGLLTGTPPLYPRTWAPVFLFSFPGDSAPFPNYPRYADGTVAGSMADRLYYLFDSTFLFRDGRAFGADGLPPLEDPGWLLRCPLERRTVMYWSVADQTMADIDRNRPEALFTWDADDGIENGEYMLYIGMAPAKLRSDLIDANDASIAAFPGQSLLTPFGADFAADPAFGGGTNSGGLIKVALEAITDPSKARGMARADALPGAPGLTHPDNWLRSSPENVGEDVGIYEPGADGTVFYGNNAAGGWRPKMVRVTDNFLALRVRNVGEGVAAITHVVLAPRKRVPGKINVNTAMNRVVQVGSRGEIFNPLLAVPGVVDVGGAIAPNDVIGPLSGAGGQPWPAPDSLTGAAGPGAAFHLSQTLMSSRPEHPDGRYYATLSDLTRETPQGYPLSDESNPVQRKKEIYERFRRMANILTVRSDVFEIIALVQAGYGVDQDGDGWFNYRSNDEFVVTAESKGRVVYERRVPSDRADEPVE